MSTSIVFLGENNILFINNFVAVWWGGGAVDDMVRKFV